MPHNANAYPTPLDLMRLGIATTTMMAQAQAVIAMRLCGMAGLWPVSASENTRMVSEKVAAMQSAASAANRAFLSGKRPDQIATAALRPIARKTRANATRLGKGGLRLP
ncbi:Antifreeze protein, type I [Oceaniovalibus guishaninsula JLT2003]|uniref:Antifreeze protein, type I n=1 Tax=Oceaniovalibus guishaninsula JLT2003 TaxID=1231392 RepID=K2HR95_9RHOB|nr:hypothetical protein [Oceaniovalibus guishaninsula]EKE45279.1 Antifreeze protein, type I [Oceaniovalibus guishaninsula JLT2003]